MDSENSVATTLENWLKSEPFELYLGGGFFGFYAHVGFSKALEEKKLQFKKIYGASAGAIVGAMLANAYPASEVEKIVLKIKRHDFWDPGFGLGLLKGNKFHEILTKHLPLNFSELKIPLEITVFDVMSLKIQRINSGDLPGAVRGSSAFPGLFQPVNANRRIYMDGGLFDKFPSQSSRVLAHCFGKSNAVTKEENRLVLSLKNLPRSGPTKMHLAKEIIEFAYEQTLRLLEQPIRP